MKNYVWVLLFLVFVSSSWAQMPTATPAPNLIFKTKNLNFPNAVPPLEIFVYRHRYPAEAAETNTSLMDIAILDNNNRSAVVYGAMAPGVLFDVGNGVNKDDIYFEEFNGLRPSGWTV